MIMEQIEGEINQLKEHERILRYYHHTATQQENQDIVLSLSKHLLQNTKSRSCVTFDPLLPQLYIIVSANLTGR